MNEPPLRDNLNLCYKIRATSNFTLKNNLISQWPQFPNHSTPNKVSNLFSAFSV